MSRVITCQDHKKIRSAYCNPAQSRRCQYAILKANILDLLDLRRR